jgi:hypothetical protein
MAISLDAFFDEMEKIASMFGAPGLPLPGLTMPQLSPMQRDSMMGVYTNAMQAERDPMRRRRLFEQAKAELGPYSMPLMKHLGQ